MDSDVGMDVKTWAHSRSKTDVDVAQLIEHQVQSVIVSCRVVRVSCRVMRGDEEQGSGDS